MQTIPSQSPSSPPSPDVQDLAAQRLVHAPCPDAELRRAISQLRRTLDRLPE